MIRTLFIDNYDSFSYNLIHFITVHYNAAPIVVPNTISIDVICAIVAEHAIDAIIVGPGPGTPHNDTDIGVTKLLFNNHNINMPILG